MAGYLFFLSFNWDIWFTSCILRFESTLLLYCFYFHLSCHSSGWFVAVPLLSYVQLFATPWTAACQVSLSFTISQSLLKVMSIESVMPSNYLILCRPLILCFQSFPASGSCPMSQFFASGGQSIGVSASASVLPMNIQDWFPLGLIIANNPLGLGLLASVISLLSKGLSKVFSSMIVQKHQFFSAQASLWFNSQICTWLLEKAKLWLDRLISKVMSLFCNMLSRLVIAFLPRSKCLLISWLQSLSTVILETKKKSLSLFLLFPHLFATKWWGQMPWSSFFECWVLIQLFNSPL